MNLKHQFLMAMPGLAGDYFADTLTFVCEHNDEGAMGILVNRPSDTTLVELFAQLGLKTARKWAEVQVLEGGPVARERGFVLHTNDKTFPASVELDQGLCLSTALEVLDAIANDAGPEKFLVTLGYAGWEAGQLENEIQNNVWLTTNAAPEVLFDVPYPDRLQAAADSLGIDIRLISGHAGHA